MKKQQVLFFTFLALIMVMLAGCGKKTALAPEQFKTTMEAKGYEVQEATNQFPADSGVVKVYIALKNDYQIEFYEIETDSQAKQAFAENKANFEAAKSSSSSNTNVETDSYSKYTQTSNGEYMVVSRIGKTFIYLHVDEERKDEVNGILDELGY